MKIVINWFIVFAILFIAFIVSFAISKNAVIIMGSIIILAFVLMSWLYDLADKAERRRKMEIVRRAEKLFREKKNEKKND